MMGEGEVGIKNLTGNLKVLLLLLSIIGIVTPSVLGWVNFDDRIDDVENAVSENELENKEKFKELDTLDSTHSEDIVSLEKREIARNGDFDMLRQDNARLEGKLDLALSEIKQLVRSE